MFLALCRDFADGRSAKIRLSALQPHLTYIEAILDKIVVAGPLRGTGETGATGGTGENGDDAIAAITGSLLIYNVDSEAAARELLEADPYFSADIWESVEIRNFQPVAGEWIGGKTW
jgi:uncharacterized protein YciI